MTFFFDHVTFLFAKRPRVEASGEASRAMRSLAACAAALLVGCVASYDLVLCKTSADGACTSCYVGYYLNGGECPLVTAQNWCGPALVLGLHSSTSCCAHGVEFTWRVVVYTDLSSAVCVLLPARLLPVGRAAA